MSVAVAVAVSVCDVRGVLMYNNKATEQVHLHSMSVSLSVSLSVSMAAFVSVFMSFVRVFGCVCVYMSVSVCLCLYVCVWRAWSVDAYEQS